MTSTETAELTFPPLLWGEATRDDVMDHAVMRATLGCEAGLIAHNVQASIMQAALVLTPDVPLARAMAMLPLCGVSLQNALGALAPPEVAVHLDWHGGIRINGARCGGFDVRAATDDPEVVPDWMVVGFTLPLLPGSDDPGETPDQTALYAEGCADVSAPHLLEAWARHTLNWIARWESEGPRALHSEWRGLAHGIGEDVTFEGRSGTFLGVDEDFGMLLRDTETTQVIPLTYLLETSQ
ncbi:biotin/lipoate--protein ligase family protein [Tropicimonas marinistellae]|uniref:biotin/lipoate--protein ligase family protein n=1 Tax=Tropicimonas marinistellae TaxID=1739787 RepID=UPI00082AB673|nr:biotin/lipoate--protein ligase family protein [Tropicimonas marinistellae]